MEFVLSANGENQTSKGYQGMKLSKLCDYLLIVFILIALVVLWGSEYILKYINFEMRVAFIT